MNMPLIRFISRKLFYAAAVLLGINLVTFVLFFSSEYAR